MWLTVGKWVVRIYGILFITAVGGFIGANFLGIVGSLFFIPENTAVHAMPWVHGGWYAGTLLAFAGAVTGNVRFANGASLRIRDNLEATTRNNSRGSRQRETGDRERTVTNKLPSSSSAGVLGGMFWMGLLGGFLGIMLGGSLLMFWFSLSYSPYAPAGWGSSVSIAKDPIPGSVISRHSHQTNHPVALKLLYLPALTGAVIGATFGGVACSMGSSRQAV